MLEPLSILGIGSVPFSQNKNSCQEIFEHWDIPYWPQYPKRSLRENFLFQFLSSFPGLHLSDTNATFDENQFQKEEVPYRKKLEAALSNKHSFDFEPPIDWALGYSQLKDLAASFPAKKVIKLQIVSPATVWEAFFKNRVTHFLTSKVWEALNLTLIVSGLAQIRRILSWNKIPIIVIDEPLRQKEVGTLQKLVQSFKNEKALVGIHACSNQNWEGYDTLDIDLFHFDVTVCTDFSSTQKDFLQKLVIKKGWLGWGIVPTLDISAPRGMLARDLLMWAKRIAEPGLATQQVLHQSLLAPSCGMGTLTSEEERAIFDQLRTLSLELKFLESHLTKKIQNQS